MTDVNSILAEMKEIGAVGGHAPKKPLPEPEISRVDEVEVTRANPGPTLKDARGSRTVELLGQAIDQLGVLQETLRQLRDVWHTEDVGATPTESREDRLLAEIRKRKAPELALEPPSEAPRAPVPADLAPSEAQEHPDLEAAREAALAKIRGGQLGDPLKAQIPHDDDDDEDIPFVGSDRALPPGKQPEEMVIKSIPLSGKGG